MEIIIQSKPEAASTIAARIIVTLLRKKPDAVLGLASGNSPLLLYRELVRLHRAGQLDFGRVTTFNLDEYVGLGPDHPASYHHFMWENFFNHINIPPDNVHIPDGLAEDTSAVCREYEGKIHDAGGIDLQILGLGANGHIAFNEPGSSLASRTRVKTLAKQTREDDGKHFDGDTDMPVHAITMGVGTIMDARQCVMLAFGAAKARAVAATVEGPITAMHPASILQMHRTVRLCLDEPAAAELKRADYYRWVYDHKLPWQRY